MAHHSPPVAHMGVGVGMHPYGQAAFAPPAAFGVPFGYPPHLQPHMQAVAPPHPLQTSSPPAPAFAFPPTDDRRLADPSAPMMNGGAMPALGQPQAAMAALPYAAPHNGAAPFAQVGYLHAMPIGQQPAVAMSATPVDAHTPMAAADPTKRPRSRPAASPAQAVPAGSSAAAAAGGGGRAAPSVSNANDVQIEVGPGQCLGDIPLLVKRFEKVSNDDPRTKLLYTVCFPTFSGTIPDRTAKKSLRQFSGWASPEMRAAANVRLQEYADDVDLLRKVARLLDLSHEGSGDEVAARMEAYLASPAVVVHPPKEEVDAAAPVTKKRRKPADKSEKKKRPPNPYLLFANEKREEVVRSKPDLQMMEVNRILGQLWASVPDAERQPYIENAARLREVWDREHPEQAAAARAAGGSGSGRKKRRANNGAVVLDAIIAEQPDAEIDDSDAMSDAVAAAAAAGRMASATPVAPSPAPIDHELAAQLQLSVARFLAKADLTRVTLKSVKMALVHEFSEKVVLHHQQLISNFVDAELLRI